MRLFQTQWSSGYLADGAFLLVDFAIYVGVGASILLYLRKAADPHLVEYGFTEEGELQELEKRQRSDLEISIVHVEESFLWCGFFWSRFDDFVLTKKVVILKMRNVDISMLQAVWPLRS